MSASTLHERLPLFPLNTVLFPDGLLELKIFEARYLDLMSRCMRAQQPFGVVALQQGTEARVSDASAVLHRAGTLAELIEVDSAQTGILLVRARGTHRFTLIGSPAQQADGLWICDAQAIEDDEVVAPNEGHAGIVKGLADAIAALGAQGAVPFLEPHRLDSAGWVANRWLEILPIPTEAKLRLMTLENPTGRLDIVEASMRGQQSTH